MRTTSPGLVALLPGIFSALATTPTILIGSLSSETTCIVAITLAAPHISNFISSMVGGGLRLIPPVSKVMPFPTIAYGLSPFFPP